MSGSLMVGVGLEQTLHIFLSLSACLSLSPCVSHLSLCYLNLSVSVCLLHVCLSLCYINLFVSVCLLHVSLSLCYLNLQSVFCMCVSLSVTSICSSLSVFFMCLSLSHIHSNSLLFSLASSPPLELRSLCLDFSGLPLFDFWGLERLE